MEKIIVSRTDGEVMVTLLPHKDGSGWSFVNLTKGHICPCKFDSKKEGIKDLDSKPNVISYQIIEQKNHTNADRIRAMSDKELAVKISNQSISSLCDIVCGRDCKAFPTLNKTSQQRCVEIVLDWLQQPAEEET